MIDRLAGFFRSVFAKGQVQTPPYRFIARSGGYAWVQTQATLVYGSSRDSSKPQAVVCVHTCIRFETAYFVSVCACPS